MTTLAMLELAKKLKNTLLPAVLQYGKGAEGAVLRPPLEQIADFCEKQEEYGMAAGFRRIADAVEA